MIKITAAITAVGKYVPEYVLTNKELETMVDTNDEWITTRTGIKERRVLKEEGLGTSYMAIKAAEDLLQKSNTNPAEIDLVIVATATPDLPVASTAAYVASEIGSRRLRLVSRMVCVPEIRDLTVTLTTISTVL